MRRKLAIFWLGLMFWLAVFSILGGVALLVILACKIFILAVIEAVLFFLLIVYFTGWLLKEN